jgi:hypothetical protein
MLVQRAYKTELELNNEQVTACRQHAGAARWAYNWGLRVKQERYRATKKSPSAVDLHRKLNTLKKSEVPWMYQVSKCAPPRGPAKPGCCIPALLSPMRPQKAREVERQAGVSSVQD